MTAALEDIKTIDLGEWLTLNTASSPTKLKQGQTPNMENVWVDEKPGSVITANGFDKVGETPSGNPSPFCINYFKTSSGEQTFVVSDNATVYTTVDFQNFTVIISGLSNSFQLRGMVIRDKLWLTNGSDAVRTFDGTTVVVLDGTAGTPNVPKGRYIGFHDERVWMYHLPSDRSAARFTALVNSSGTIIAPDNSAAWPTDNQLQISEGDADFGTGLVLYRGYLYAFKQYGIYRIIGYDEYTYSRVKTRASTGSRFNESLQIKDNLIHMIGVDGIYVFDGEDAERISDIIDPASASQTAFGFDDLQQPNTNNQFFQTTDTAGWNTGTVPTNVTVDDSITLSAADDSAADFTAAGTVATNLDLTSTPGSILLSHSASGVSSDNVALNIVPTIVGTPLNISQIGTPTLMTDGSFTNYFGATATGGGNLIVLRIAFSTAKTISRVILKGMQLSTDTRFTFYDDIANHDPISASHGSLYLGVGPGWGIQGATIGGTPTDVTFNFTPFTDSEILIGLSPTTPGGTVKFTEMQVFETAYSSTGQFISKKLDLGAIPASLGNFNATDTVLTNTTITYYTQSSADGTTWDAAVAVTNGGAVGSTVRRYLRWRADLTSNGTVTPVISAAYLASQYISAIRNTGGGIFAWGPFESVRDPAGQTINFYYRTATLSGGIAGATWNAIVPGGVISDPVANQYVQFKIEVLGGTATQLPSITSVTINWVVGSGTQPNTLQNVASYVWRNRYWLAAAGPGATANDTILVRGKKTFDSPWQLKDWPIISFTRFHDDFYGCSSLDGSIYRLDTGYSKDGSSLDSFFETGDFTFGGFYVTLTEILIELDRMGPYTLAVGVSGDQGISWTEKTVDLTLASRITFTKRLNFDIGSDILRFRLRINAADRPFQVHRLIGFYRFSPARGSIN